MPNAPLISLPCTQAARWLPNCPSPFLVAHSGKNRPGYRLGNLALHGEYMLYVSVVAFRPNVGIRQSVDKLYCYPCLPCDAPDTSLHYVTHTQFSRHLLNV